MPYNNFWEKSDDVIYLKEKSKEFEEKLSRLNTVRRELAERRNSGTQNRRRFWEVRRGIRFFHRKDEFNL